MNDAMIDRTADKLGVGYRHMETLLHALGFQKRGGFKWSVGGWRNWFDAGESDDAPLCADLEATGFMKQAAGGHYNVSKAGMAALRLSGWKLTTDDHRPADREGGE